MALHKMTGRLELERLTWYESDDGRLRVELFRAEYDRSRNSLMTMWVKRGMMPKFLGQVWCVQTFFTEGEGAERREIGEAFNPQVKKKPLGGLEINFAWMLEATPENKERLLGEIERRYAGGIQYA